MGEAHFLSWPSLAAPGLHGFACPLKQILYIYTVVYDLLRVRRDGMLLPRWQLGSLAPARGVLTVRDTYLKDLGRHSMVATLVGMDKVPDLVDVTLLETLGEHLVLTGFERSDDRSGNRVDYAQTWLLRASQDQTPPPVPHPTLQRAGDAAAPGRP